VATPESAGAVPSADAVRALPKVELHVHLEGTLEAPRIAELARDAGEPLHRADRDLFAFEHFDGFLEFLDWTCGLVRTREQLEAVAYDFAQRAHHDGTRYAEVIVNPTHWPHWELAALVAAISDGFVRAKRDGLADCRLLLSLLRSQSSDDAMALVRWMADVRPSLVVGLSVDGNEARTGPTGPRFAPAFALARAEGFGCAAHAGESSGPEGVVDALEQLRVDRIDHGVRAIEDPALVDRLARSAVVLDVCLTSNVTMMYPSLDAHPLPRLLEAGVGVTMNTDDPAYLGIDLTGELALAATTFDWSLDDVVARVRDAIDAAFCDAERAEQLHADVDRYLEEAAAAVPGRQQR
jgi:adenosine deaminase